jgi:hypothetical protein
MTERITAPRVYGELQKHIQKHDDKYDPKMHRHDILLVGQDGDDGLCSDIRDLNKRLQDLEKIKAELSGVKWAVVVAVAVNIALRFLPV